MVAHFCKSGVIRPGTCSLWCILYFTKVAKGISSLIVFFPFLYLYSFPRGFMHEDENILVFPALFEGSQGDPPGWGVWCGAAPVLWCRQAVLLAWICLQGHRMGWAEPGLVCARVGQSCWGVLNLPRSQHMKQGVEGTGEQPPVATSSNPHLLVCTELRSQPELAASASWQWLSMGFQVKFCTS